MTNAITRDEWLQRLKSSMEPVGDCVEWQGPYLKTKTPLVYVPNGVLIPYEGRHKQSARIVLWALHHGDRPPNGTILRTTCGNYKCVAVEHMKCIPRAMQSVEQSRRGELLTPMFRAAAITRARAKSTKLSMELAREIRASAEPSSALALRYSVSAGTINAVRRGQLWAEAANGASIFSWRPAA